MPRDPHQTKNLNPLFAASPGTAAPLLIAPFHMLTPVELLVQSYEQEPQRRRHDQCDHGRRAAD